MVTISPLNAQMSGWMRALGFVQSINNLIFVISRKEAEIGQQASGQVQHGDCVGPAPLPDFIQLNRRSCVWRQLLELSGRCAEAMPGHNKTLNGNNINIYSLILCTPPKTRRSSLHLLHLKMYNQTDQSYDWSCIHGSTQLNSTQLNSTQLKSS